MSAFPYLPSFEVQFDPDRQQEFVIARMLARVHTTQLVRVLAVRPAAGKVGFVDVLPLVQEVDTARKVIEQAPIYNVPYVRYQGGPSAVVLDPAIGDIGLAAFAERDITSVKATTQQGPAATDRHHDMADGLYIGGVLNPEPTQYVRFQPAAGGIDIHSPASVNISAVSAVNISANTVTLTAPGGFVINAPTTLNGTLTGTATGAGAYQFAGTLSAADVIVPNAALNTHVHDENGSVTDGPHN